MKKKDIQKEMPRVRCGECRWFKRDTEGRNRTPEGEYFMGVCKAGRTPDSPVKQFANKGRHCNAWRAGDGK